MLLIRGNITKICSRNNQSNSSEINLGKMWKAKLYRIYNATDNSVTTQHKHNKKNTHTHRNKIENNKSYYKHQVWHHMIQKLVITLKLSILGFLL